MTDSLASKCYAAAKEYNAPLLEVLASIVSGTDTYTPLKRDEHLGAIARHLSDPAAYLERQAQKQAGPGSVDVSIYFSEGAVAAITEIRDGLSSWMQERDTKTAADKAATRERLQQRWGAAGNSPAAQENPAAEEPQAVAESNGAPAAQITEEKPRPPITRKGVGFIDPSQWRNRGIGAGNDPNYSKRRGEKNDGTRGR